MIDNKAIANALTNTQLQILHRTSIILATFSIPCSVINKYALLNTGYNTEGNSKSMITITTYVNQHCLALFSTESLNSFSLFLYIYEKYRV